MRVADLQIAFESQLSQRHAETNQAREEAQAHLERAIRAEARGAAPNVVRVLRPGKAVLPQLGSSPLFIKMGWVRWLRPGVIQWAPAASVPKGRPFRCVGARFPGGSVSHFADPFNAG